MLENMHVTLNIFGMEQHEEKSKSSWSIVFRHWQSLRIIKTNFPHLTGICTVLKQFCYELEIFMPFQRGHTETDSFMQDSQWIFERGGKRPRLLSKFLFDQKIFLEVSVTNFILQVSLTVYFVCANSETILSIFVVSSHNR